MRIPNARAARAAALIAAALALAAAWPAPASAHEGNPKYRSVVTGVTPATPGLHVEVLDYDDALQLTNRSGKPVVIDGYAGEPYARVLADGTVQVNERSPAVQLNEDAGQETPVNAVPVKPGAPQWRTLDRTGRIEWHDHRIHYRAGPVAPQVHDQARRTQVGDWRVPLRIGAQPGAIAGMLTWIGSGSSSSFPFAAVVSLVVLASLALTGVLLVRRRRGSGAGGEPAR